MASASSLLAGCGGGAHHAQPRLPKADAAQLIFLAQAVARDAKTDGCATRNDIAQLSAKARELVAAGSVPLRLREPLLNGVDAVAGDAPPCTPPPPAPKPQPHDHPKPPKDHHDHGPHGHD